MTKENPLRWLPGVDELLGQAEIQAYSDLPRLLVVDTIRQVLEKYRQDLRLEREEYQSAEELNEALLADLVRLLGKRGQPMLRSVINATGVVLHTNLGRAVLSKPASQAVAMVAAGYTNLELDLDSGNRGSRYAPVEEMLKKMTGAQDCLVVNNNAAAVLLALDTLAKGKESIVSRGELVEIGGAFRIPEVMERSGSCLVEVGTTNKTYLADYEKAITSETGVLLKVHTSNYRITGFTHEASMSELAQLAKRYQVPLMNDLGSGCLFDLKGAGVGNEPTVHSVIAAGADVVTFSGDKLLGGPQAGIIVGKKEYIARMKKNPLTRALRIDKMTVAALEATLRIYLDPQRVSQEVPTIEMLTRPLVILSEQAEALAENLSRTFGELLAVKIQAGVSMVGGGSLPMVELPTMLVMIQAAGISADKMAATLRQGSPAVLVYIREDWLVLDPRTILPGEQAMVVSAIGKACEDI